MAERWDVRWNDLNDRLRTLAAEHDEDFVAAFVDRDAGVEIRRSASTDQKPTDQYAVLVVAAGFRGPSFRQVPVSVRDARAIDRLIFEAEGTLEAAGIRVWSIGGDGRAGDTRIVSYEDPGGRGLPQALLEDLARFPPGTVELRRVAGPTHGGA